ncbi:urate hydroxylase PuuD [Coraliomargarita parva]|uniref:urate hydroxylase PuuD n=1 Tax=Coraliomargarita parva TaxID=3014050 RepID=UPI0022B2FBB9|nr:urate hydroxylase PuuD [Coraliomargarita parva]
MSPELIEFFNVVLRFTHVVAAIMWIGNSLLFTWMEINFIKDPNKNAKGALGHMNMLHAGGVYFLEKRVIDPTDIPAKLHVFKWQSYTTWLSGLVLLILTFYTRSGSLLLDPAKTDMPGWQASVISLLSLIGFWFVYDGVWRSPLKKKPLYAVATLVVIFLAYALWINGIFNGRFVYLQLGAMIATTMSANVRTVIIPNQKKIMANLLEGKPHDLEIGHQAKMRSLTNHYVTFPVIFLMLSAHFPMLYGSEHNILLMMIICSCLVIIKYMMNIYNEFSEWLHVSIATFVLGVFAVIVVLSLPGSGSANGTMPALSEDAIKGKALFSSKGCSACHLPTPTTIAPTLTGLYGHEVELQDGSKVTADEDYIRESILNPGGKIVRGFGPTMPGLATILSDDDVDELVEYVKSL